MLGTLTFQTIHNFIFSDMENKMFPGWSHIFLVCVGSIMVINTGSEGLVLVDVLVVPKMPRSCQINPHWGARSWIRRKTKCQKHIPTSIVQLHSQVSTLECLAFIARCRRSQHRLVAVGTRWAQTPERTRSRKILGKSEGTNIKAFCDLSSHFYGWYVEKIWQKTP